jgi:hypothetical protein
VLKAVYRIRRFGNAFIIMSSVVDLAVPANALDTLQQAAADQSS